MIHFLNSLRGFLTVKTAKEKHKVFRGKREGKKNSIFIHSSKKKKKNRENINKTYLHTRKNALQQQHQIFPSSLLDASSSSQNR